MTTGSIDRMQISLALRVASGLYTAMGLGITENYDVGTREADEGTSFLLINTLGSLLQYYSTNMTLNEPIEVSCTPHDTATCKLEVAAVGPLIAWYDTIGREVFGKWATRIGCTLSLVEVEDDDPVIMLLFPSSSI